MAITRKLAEKLAGIEEQMRYRETDADAKMAVGRYVDASRDYLAACMLAMALSDVYEGLGKGYEAQAEDFAAKQGHFSMAAGTAEQEADRAEWEAIRKAKEGVA
jgi:hypothetical protein